MRQRLTDRVVRQKAPESGMVEIHDTLLPAFGIRIGQHRRTYFVTGRVPDPQPDDLKRVKQVRRTVGTTEQLSLADAREKARGMIADLQRGIDPQDAEKAAQREAALARRNTFAAVAEDFMNERAKHLRTRDEYQRKLDADILPEWGALPIAEIERADVKALIQKKAARTPIAANRLLTLSRRFSITPLTRNSSPPRLPCGSGPSPRSSESACSTRPRSQTSGPGSTPHLSRRRCARFFGSCSSRASVVVK